MTTVQIPDEIMHQYEDHARAIGYDTDTLIREALIEKLEDIADIRIAEERFARGLTPVPFAQVVKDLGLDD